eukprot:3681306-Amphidinium_carterae.2
MAPATASGGATQPTPTSPQAQQLLSLLQCLQVNKGFNANAHLHQMQIRGLLASHHHDAGTSDFATVHLASTRKLPLKLCMAYGELRAQLPICL